MLINTKTIEEVPDIGETTKKKIEEYYKDKSLIVRALGIKSNEKE